MPFKPGQSGNPSGRPAGFAGLARRVRTSTNDGLDLVEFAIEVFKGTLQTVGGKAITIKQRWEAMVWLADRGYGKAVQPSMLQIENVTSETKEIDFTKLTQDELDMVEQTLTKATHTLTEVIDVESK